MALNRELWSCIQVPELDCPVPVPREDALAIWHDSNRTDGIRRVPLQCSEASPAIQIPELDSEPLVNDRRDNPFAVRPQCVCVTRAATALEIERLDTFATFKVPELQVPIFAL